MCGTAISRFGLSAFDFYELAPVEFKFALKTKNDEEENSFQLKYEVARFLAKHIWNSAGKSVKRFITKVEEVEGFTWDTEKVKVQSVEEQKNIFHSIARAFKNKKPMKRKTKGEKK